MRNILIPLFAVLSFSLLAQDSVSVEVGKTIFRNQCATCHNRDMKSDLTGPALGLAESHWSEFPREDLYQWVRNSQVLIGEGHPRAVAMWEDWKPTTMPPMQQLTDAEIESVFAYIEQQYTATPVVATPGVGTAEESEADNTYLYWILLILLLVVTFVLTRIIANLNRMVAVHEGLEKPPVRSLLQILTSRSVIGFVLFVLIIFGGYTTVSNGIAFGRQQGYQPEQPIKYSHAMHAGIQGIDCNYCHDGARRSKHAVIPAANTCMNCHRAIKTGSMYGTAEITKIFASIGYDPSNDKYMEGYESYSEDTIRQIYTQWITDQYKSTNSLTELDLKGERLVDSQWEEIKLSLTNDVKKSIYGPIEWVRIHHLPDHVYFSHEQHVTIAKLDCQECHGLIETMEVVEQYAPLSMGWCINCHRQTNVQFNDNPYYQTYARYHEELASGQRDRVTVEDIGGLECQKCHY